MKVVGEDSCSLSAFINSQQLCKKETQLHKLLFTASDLDVGHCNSVVRTQRHSQTVHNKQTAEISRTKSAHKTVVTNQYDSCRVISSLVLSNLKHLNYNAQSHMSYHIIQRQHNRKSTKIKMNIIHKCIKIIHIDNVCSRSTSNTQRDARRPAGDDPTRSPGRSPYKATSCG